MPSTPQLIGIQELYNPGDIAEVDVVAVHGLNGNAVDTWSNGSTCWLKDSQLLPKYIPNARILAYGYNATIFGVKGRVTSSDGILQHAQTLIAQLAADREWEGAGKRPIVFLCHSLGGIVVKRALAYAASRTSYTLSHLHRIYVSTHSIIFFGTPHLGSSKASMLSTLTKMTSLAIPRKLFTSSSSLTSALKEDSETLQNVNDQFSPLMARLKIFFLWEQKPIDLKYTKDYIVEESSAAPMMIAGVERAGIMEDHRGMCRFRSDKEQGFRTVVAALKRYIAEAPGTILERHERAEETAWKGRLDEAKDLVKGMGVDFGGGILE